MRKGLSSIQGGKALPIFAPAISLQLDGSRPCITVSTGAVSDEDGTPCLTVKAALSSGSEWRRAEIQTSFILIPFCCDTRTTLIFDCDQCTLGILKRSAQHAKVFSVFCCILIVATPCYKRLAMAPVDIRCWSRILESGWANLECF